MGLAAFSVAPSAAGRPGSVGSDFSVFRVQIEGQTRAARGSAARRPVRVYIAPTPQTQSPQSAVCVVARPDRDTTASHGESATAPSCEPSARRRSGTDRIHS